MDAARVDRWLWAVRVFKTRSAATDACRAGHVRVNGNPAKPAAVVRVGDVVTVRRHGRDRVLEVARVIEARVSAPIAGECVLDRTPAQPAEQRAAAPVPLHGGRPTKRERRELDRFRRR